MQEVSFDPEKAQCCVVENGQGLTHGSGGKGYGLASTGISSGCYQWKVPCHQLSKQFNPRGKFLFIFHAVILANAGTAKLWPGDHIRPVKLFNQAR